MSTQATFRYEQYTGRYLRDIVTNTGKRAAFIKYLMVSLCVLIVATANVHAKEKLYVLNTASPGGSFNAQMTAFAVDLERFYDVEYIQANGCSKASSLIDKIVQNGHRVFYIWNGLRSADFLAGKQPDCGKLPSPTNFVNSVIKYPIFLTRSGGIDGVDVFQNGRRVGYNSITNRLYLAALAKSHNVEWKLIQYENSKSVVLGVLNSEVDLAMINSAASYWSKRKILKGLFSLNPQGEVDTPSLTANSSFAGASWGQADLFLTEGGDNTVLRQQIQQILSDPQSRTHMWYKTAVGYQHTLDLPIQAAIQRSRQHIENWVLY